MKALLVSLILPLSIMGLHGGEPSLQTHPIRADRELLITDVGVVDSEMAQYPGSLSFGHLIEELAGDEGPKKFILDWARLWEKEQVVNGDVIPARPAIRERLIDPWKEMDGAGDLPDEAWSINLANAPFRLLGIANRADLGAGIFVGEREEITRTQVNMYYGSSAPELRFIYEVTDQQGKSLEGGFTMILEYGLAFPRISRDRATFAKVLSSYAAYWHQLGAHEEIDEAYLSELSAITTMLTDRLPEGEERVLSSLQGPDGEALIVKRSPNVAPLLNQIRTNDGAFGDIQELRQCHVSANTVKVAALNSTPNAGFLDTKSKDRRYLVRYLNEHAREIKSGQFIFPTSIRGRSRRSSIQVLTGHSQIPENDPGFHWDVRGIRDDEVRRRISMGTCNGCHSGETQTAFYHIHPREAGVASKISDYLKADHVTADPTRPTERPRGASEMQQREVIFTALLNPGMGEAAIRRLVRKRMRGSH